jgi:hypothetical protein
MKQNTRPKRALGLSFLALAVGITPATAMNLPSSQKINAGPLGELSLSGGFEGYLYALSGNGTKSVLGDNKSAGSQVRIVDLKVQKPTGLLQYTLELKTYDSVYFGVQPSKMSTNEFTLGPIYAAFITLAPSKNFSISAGQIYSLEGWESSDDWKNANLIDSPLYYVQNSSSRGVSASYSKGNFSATVSFGDGFDSGVFNVTQELVSYSFNKNNTLSVYGTQNLGHTGPNTFAYGGGTTGSGYPSYYAAYVNSDMYGAYYDYINGNLNLVPEVQYVYSKPNHAMGLDKFTSNFGAELIGNYQFGNSPWSVGSMVFYYKNIGPQAWYLNANSGGVGFGVTPSWMVGNIFARGEVGMLHMTDLGTPSTGGGFGTSGTDRNQVMGILSAGVVF